MATQSNIQQYNETSEWIRKWYSSSHDTTVGRTGKSVKRSAYLVLVQKGSTKRVNGLRDVQQVLSIFWPRASTALQNHDGVEIFLDVLGQQRGDQLTALHAIEWLRQLQKARHRVLSSAERSEGGAILKGCTLTGIQRQVAKFV